MKELKLPIFASLVMLLILAVVSFGHVPISQGTEGVLKVTFLDVGQGDATFIESPTGTQVLIDGGKGSVVLRPLAQVMGFFDHDIDMIVATHPDKDHIGGLIDVLERYTVGTIVMTENINDTPAFETFLDRVHAENARIIYARRGQVYDLGVGAAGSTTLAILFPDHDPTHLESNVSSIVSKLTYGANAFVFTGDSPQEIEEYLLGIGSSSLQSDVLKVGHHGSRTSSSEIFLGAVSPTYAIISAGKNNSYGHPHKEVTDLLNVHGITTKNTAEGGSIFSESDGASIMFR